MKSQVRLLENYIKRGHKRVHGWLNPEVLHVTKYIDTIQKQNGIDGHLGEIGIFHGKLFILLCLLLRDTEKIVAVDLFDDDALNIDNSKEKIKNIFLRNMNQHVKTFSQMAVIQKDSLTLDSKYLQECTGGKIRLFSIDGGHDSNIAYHDLETVSGALADGGVIILDDYFNEDWPGVSEGTNRFIQKHGYEKIVPFLIGANKVFFTSSKEHAEIYITELQKCSLGTSQKDSEFFHSKVICFGIDKLSIIEKIERTSLWRKLRKTTIGRGLKRAIRGYA